MFIKLLQLNCNWRLSKLPENYILAASFTEEEKRKEKKGKEGRKEGSKEKRRAGKVLRTNQAKSQCILEVSRLWVAYAENSKHHLAYMAPASQGSCLAG